MGGERVAAEEFPAAVGGLRGLQGSGFASHLQGEMLPECSADLRMDQCELLAPGPGLD